MRLELWLTEGAQLKALCREPAELLDAACREGITITDFSDRGGGTCTFYVRAPEAERVVRLGSVCGAEISVLRRRGLAHFLRRFRKRLYLLLLPLPFLIAFLWLSTRIWEIRVEGNRTIPRGDILDALETAGVYPGVSGLHLDNQRIRGRMQSMLSDLIWCTVQVRGSRARVIVRERRSPPELVDEALAREVAASRGGRVVRLRVLEGKAAVKKGDTVAEGDTLITGRLSDRQEEARLVHAMGSVDALTLREKTLALPALLAEKLPTGRETKGFALKIGDLRLIFHNESSISYGCYDKIQNEYPLRLFGLALPVSVIRTVYREYLPVWREISAEEAEGLLRERLAAWLRKAAPKAEPVRTDYLTEASGELICTTLRAECLEDIGFEREIGG
ncbi:MAG: sporulation protein YqfD [Oscillospiraceae bacterium]|nr:sporulation protein YqfD [Oscillospiraceae bacterium]MBR4692886.1 sporulation protein YqfD [Oscillospiraceae bacterium]